MTGTCVFCEIAARVRPAHVVLDHGAVIGFLDVRPLFPGHTLVIPRSHHETLPELPDDLLAPLLRAARLLAGAMGEALGAEGTFVALNDRVSQSVPHVHLHVVPRRRGDGLRGFFWPRGRYGSDEEAAAVAGSLRAALDATA